MSTIVGGGPKKILYTLNTVRRIGLKKSTKALRANNTCKACGLGMGGQQGGMHNEEGEFPSVCNKSVQAQSTDIQGPIPLEVFQHTMQDFRELSAFELERLGRLNIPLYKPKNSDLFEAISWDKALYLASSRLQKTKPEKSFFYASGRASNEAGFILQLMARIYGTNNVNNCSYYCHQATGVGLQSVIGSGTATIELGDLKHCDTFFLIGANPSSNHPRLIHQLKAIRERGGKVVVINPAKEPGLVKFSVPKSLGSMLTGGTEIASHYLQPQIGSDWYVFAGLAKSILNNNQQDNSFITQCTEDFTAFKEQCERLSWQSIEQNTGLTQEDIEAVAQVYAESESSVFSWGMGITHHLNGVENVEAIANLALLRGMIGKPGAGLLPLRGHSNVQGIGTVGVKPELSPAMCKAIEADLNIVLPEQKGLDTLACLRVAHEGEMNTALIMGGNLFEASPNTAWANQALDNIDCKIYLTTTLNRGHVFANSHSESIIFPVMARDEEKQATTQESMFNFVRLSDGGIDRLDNVRSETDILVTLAQSLFSDTKVDFSVFSSHKNIREKIAAFIPSLSFLSSIDETKHEQSVEGRVLHTPIFPRASQKACFTIKKNKVALDAKALTLATIRSEGQFNSIIYEEQDSYRHNAPRDALLISQPSAESLGLKEGQRVMVNSEHGEMRGLQIIYFDLPAMNVMAYYPEANVLTGLTVDPRSQTPNFKSIQVEIQAM